MQSLEKTRARRVAQAEARAGIREGHYRMRDGDDWKMVYVSVEFYPRERWFISDVTMPGEPIAGTARLLDDDTKSRLENWL